VSRWLNLEADLVCVYYVVYVVENIIDVYDTIIITITTCVISYNNDIIIIYPMTTTAVFITLVLKKESERRVTSAGHCSVSMIVYTVCFSWTTCACVESFYFTRNTLFCRRVPLLTLCTHGSWWSDRKRTAAVAAAMMTTAQ